MKISGSTRAKYIMLGYKILDIHNLSDSILIMNSERLELHCEWWYNITLDKDVDSTIFRLRDGGTNEIHGRIVVCNKNVKIVKLSKFKGAKLLGGFTGESETNYLWVKGKPEKIALYERVGDLAMIARSINGKEMDWEMSVLNTNSGECLFTQEERIIPDIIHSRTFMAIREIDSGRIKVLDGKGKVIWHKAGRITKINGKDFESNSLTAYHGVSITVEGDSEVLNFQRGGALEIMSLKGRLIKKYEAS